MLYRFAGAVRRAASEESFVAVVGAAIALVLTGTVVYTLGEGWSLIDGFYFAVCTLTTSSIADPDLVLTHGVLKIFTTRASVWSGGAGCQPRLRGLRGLACGLLPLDAVAGAAAAPEQLGHGAQSRGRTLPRCDFDATPTYVTDAEPRIFSPLSFDRGGRN